MQLRTLSISIPQRPVKKHVTCPVEPSSPLRLQVEDFDSDTDGRFITEHLVPYLKELYRDLSLRCLQESAIADKKLDQTTLLQYCGLPGLINERLLKHF